MNSASLCSLAGRYENPILPQCLAPIDFLKIPALAGWNDNHIPPRFLAPIDSLKIPALLCSDYLPAIPFIAEDWNFKFNTFSSFCIDISYKICCLQFCKDSNLPHLELNSSALGLISSALKLISSALGSNLPHLGSVLPHLGSDLLHLGSDLLHLGSNLPHWRTHIFRTWAKIFRSTGGSNLPHLGSNVAYLGSNLLHSNLGFKSSALLLNLPYLGTQKTSGASPRSTVHIYCLARDMQRKAQTLLNVHCTYEVI